VRGDGDGGKEVEDDTLNTKGDGRERNSTGDTWRRQHTNNTRFIFNTVPSVKVLYPSSWFPMTLLKTS